jgi:hypothetical protein
VFALSSVGGLVYFLARTWFSWYPQQWLVNNFYALQKQGFPPGKKIFVTVTNDVQQRNIGGASVTTRIINGWHNSFSMSALGPTGISIAKSLSVSSFSLLVLPICPTHS